MLADVLSSHGNTADGYIMTAGRLDMEPELWEEFAKGKSFIIKEGNMTEYTPQEAGVGETWPAEDQNMSKLAAGLTHKRYTELLANIDLGNVVYIHGTADENAGPMTQAEIEFLEKQGATVMGIPEGTHGGVMDYSLLKEAFTRLTQ